MHRIILQSGLEWTIVEPPRLLNGPRKGKYRVAADALPPSSSKINRADVAEFMLKQLASREWVGNTPYIAD
jgi:putative NADH-flavin reductase